jgi:photosystem II stability/assembly factor-like uncharacterized protein
MRAASARTLVAAGVMLAAAGTARVLNGQQPDARLYAGMRWRSIGPFRAGRVSAVSGVAGNPAVYYVGTPGGGVFETTDGGMIWTPISDAVPVASIGALAVAPSNPDVIYFGTGDVSEVGGSVNAGDGVYKSADAGKTWTHVGLERTWHIGALWIDPHNPDIVVAAALGHTYAKDADRGVFKTSDGGRSWRKTLYKDDETGAVDVAFDAANPSIGFATVWGHYVAPGRSQAVLNGTDRGGVYKTTDEGESWAPVEGRGLPTRRLGRAGVAVASGGRLVFAIMSAQPGGGLYRSDDGGSSWRKSTADPRIQGSGYFGKVYVDPANADVVYVMQTSMYRSTDGGRTFVAYKGAPGGDDNHVLWIDPTNSRWMIMGSDQGAVVSLDGGRTWTSWYNQPTGQLYHLSTDHRWPYTIYGMQQDSGSIGTVNRGGYGAITMLDWDAVGGYEFGYIVPDPLDPDVVYAGGEGRGVWRVDRTTKQVRTVSPNVSRNGDYRTATNPPLVFSPQDPHALYEGTQFVLLTKDAGMHWQRISPDLTVRPDAPAPEPAAPGPPAPNRTAINTLALSTVHDGTIWAGTTDGLVQLTEDGGKTWRNVSPPGLTPYSIVSWVEASRFDAGTAWAAIENHATNDFRPHLFRTRDAGATWQETVAGIPAGNFVRVVREDPVRKGLLYAGTENGASVSFDGGDRWQSLQLNLPTVSVRDLTVQGTDLVAATYGRAMWILDDVTPLRQMDARLADADAFLFEPQDAIRVRRDDNNDTPIPPDMPAAQNPPAGAIIDYYLKRDASSEVTIAIYDARHQLVRTLSSVAEPAPEAEPPTVPEYWLAKPTPLATHSGMSRAVWDLRYPPPPALEHDYPIAAVYESTPADPIGPLVAPGVYQVELSAGGNTYRQPLTVVSDPRVHVTQAEFEQQLDLALKSVEAMKAAYDGHDQIAGVRLALADRMDTLSSGAKTTAALDALKDLDRKSAMLEGSQTRGGGGGAPGATRPKPSFSTLNRNLAALVGIVDGADGAPTEAMTTAYGDYCRDLTAAVAQWEDLKRSRLPAVNAATGPKAPPIPPPPSLSAPTCAAGAQR